MAHLVPESPQFQNTSEREVWQRLAGSLPGDAVLVANLRLTDETKDHEADLVVLLPDVGCLVLEVKGSSVWVSPPDNKGEVAWWIKRGTSQQRIHPVDQARDAKHALRWYVEHDPRWGSRGRIVWAHGVVTPYSVFGNDFQIPDLPRWALHDRDEQKVLAERLTQNTWGLGHGKRPPTADDLDLIVEILHGRMHTSYDINAEAEDRAATADRLTQEQATILGVTRLLNRVEVRGGAGSGKTVLALQRPRKPAVAAASGRHDVSRCSATRSAWPSTSSARSPAGDGRSGRRTSVPSRSSGFPGVPRPGPARTASSGKSGSPR